MPVDVGQWLRGLGLDQYAGAFRDNDIDGDILPELTAEDLAGIGVTSIGHRRKMLAAIETQDPDRAGREPEILGHHLAEGGQADRAATSISAMIPGSAR
jgi:hypothetical protein